MQNISDEKFLVTIGILNYNAKETIYNAINSAIEQTWGNKEIIVIDDCSNDGSYELLLTMSKEFGFKLIRNNKNYGPAYSRNRIISLANGEIICFMDDDDISHYNRIELQVKSIVNCGYPKNKTIVSICSMKRSYKSGYCKEMRCLGTNKRSPKGIELADYLLFYERNKEVDYGFGAPTCAMMSTTECFNVVGGFDESLRRVEDMDIAIRFSLNNFTFTGVDSFLVCQNSTIGSDKTPKMNLDSEVVVIKKNKSYLKSKGMYLYSRIWPKLRYCHFVGNYYLFFLNFILLACLYPKRTLEHIVSTGFKRLIHEKRIKSGL
ncbi:MULTISPECIES: glycosyltransferase family 2 protein [Prochlorococcus]|uniref:Glycosyltransferase n=1 Tax=Prochlorococcus marinus (strain SARG / CCMP1375 / SS120) TaxID=167539 RepID=Q7VAX7_PROMA|nr:MULTISPECIES: glycosyltransferase family 2 protein [Prochlorococcus]AAQ00370.1 Glycosyltransferase [Prochlorococcus marinus subsp. marinus str. CCMP1375]KGG14250.1 Glycosyltransferase [Prochlorococcus marinus str. LG]KGG22177.1 Glycosyltransferase [Prochlorococcus marinus str. SS2]KGG24505.1 Glycosyltransferase [Prochlorococcus marinus str. SS35]KGG33400.1 Glycosyltransferase [Prochlorococcus marinus str. SS51]